MSRMNFIIKWLPYLGILLVYISGAFVDIMEIDAAQYASISLEMLASGNYLEVLDRGEDYLDKPPFLFWISALSMKLFGVGTWQYKLPSILFSLLGIFGTYKLAERLYNTQIGRIAALIFGTSLAIIMINNDIKTDTILTSSIVFSLWMLVSYIETKHWIYLIGSAVAISISLLTKGPIGIVMPAMAVGGHLLLKRKWGSIFDPKWAIVLVIMGLLLLPMCIGLYGQFGTDGLKFYFWTQSFGRITGENRWQNDTTVLFFTHVFLWSFLPWTLLAIAALGKRIVQIAKDLKNESSEFYTLSGVVLVSIALSLSRFKLPHYIFIVFPLVAILTAQYIHQLKSYINWTRVQLAVSVGTILLMAVILLYSFPKGGYILPGVLLLGLIGSIMVFLNLYKYGQIVFPSVIAFIAIGLALNLHFYPQLLQYQANSMVGKWVTENAISKERFVVFATGTYGFDFYGQRKIPWKQNADQTMAAIKKGTIVYATEIGYQDLLKRNVIPDSVKLFPNFRVQNLSIQFLNPATRKEAVSNNYLLFY